MRLFTGIGLFLITMLYGCGSPGLSSYTSSNQPVNAAVSDHAVDSLVKPYRESMLAEMAEIIGYSDSFLLAYAPESPLGNFAADVVFETGFQYALEHEICTDSNAVFSLLNFGGLRTSVNKGAITRGHIYELMPFDNVIVIVKITREKMDSLVSYLANVKGQPVSNAVFIPGSGGYQVGPGKSYGAGAYYIITSDYLSGGGDNMDFFKESLQTFNTGILIREALISYIEKKQNIPYYPVQGRMYFP